MSVSAILLDPTTPLKYVAEQARDRWAEVQTAEYEICVAMRRLFDANAHRGSGKSRFVDWAERKLGIPAKLAGLFSFLGSHFERLPLTRQALEDGRITYTKAREFMKLALPEDEAEWIDYATSHTNRELERKAERTRRGTEEDVTTIPSQVTPEEKQIVRMAREKAMKEDDEPVSEGKLLTKLATKYLEGPLFGAVTTADSETSDEDPKPMPRAKLQPYCSVQICPCCLHTWVPVPRENLRVPFTDWIKALKNGAEVVDLTDHFLCDCEGDRHRRDQCPNRKPTTGPKPANRHIPAPVRKIIEARDGFRCRTPDCGNPVPLEMGHMTPYCEGTPTLPEHIGMQCEACNKMILTGALQVSGEAPFEKYHLKDGTFLGYGFDPYSHVGTGSVAPHLPESGAPEG